MSLGLITVRVKVFSATEDRTVHFHQVHVPDGARLHQRRTCAQERREVASEEIVKGYERSSGEYVVLTNDEIAAARIDTGSDSSTWSRARRRERRSRRRNHPPTRRRRPI